MINSEVVVSVYIILGVYGVALGSYLFLREETRMYGIILYLLVIDEIAYYFGVLAVFYAVSTVTVFLGCAVITYDIVSRNKREEVAQKSALYAGFAGANISMLIIGIYVWELLFSVALSLLAFELTVMALEGDVL